ncbi:ABC transporter permease [Clostridium sp. D2Q-11]|uniref:ABC transporter permease n=1 Tax=Anaeromonas frigoriresistens TaxID=2683708 RepID=A0A942USB9_9FIRM|nr:ABC transporter permease [Anaeromonas frigoriresistens]MBS4537688.1 ABC transporter permease [Anaeromonas frigoriresistens]
MSNNNNLSKEHERYIKSIKRRKQYIRFSQVSILVLFFGIWELLAQFEFIDAFLTSYPSAMFKLFFRLVRDGSLFNHIGISLMENVIGFVAGTILGILIAILLWWSEFISKVLDPYLVVLNSLPKTALAPIIILWVGAGYSGIIVTAISVSIVVTIMNVYNGFKEVDPEKVKMLKTFGATKFQTLRKVILPSSVPAMISSLKINIGLSWVGVIVGEFLVSKAGIGYLIVYGGQVFKLDLVMMSVMVLAILAAVMYQGVALIEKKYMKWRQ